MKNILFFILLISCTHKYFHPEKYHRSIEKLNALSSKCIDNRMDNLDYCQTKIRIKLHIMLHSVTLNKEYDFFSENEEKILKNKFSQFILVGDSGADDKVIFCIPDKTLRKSLRQNILNIAPRNNYDLQGIVNNILRIDQRDVFIIRECKLKLKNEVLKTDIP